MRNFFVVFILASFTTILAIRCYDCEGTSNSGCNDPFNASSAAITTGHNSCKKRGVASVIRREGETSCTSTIWSAGSGTSCCSTDLCNDAYIFRRSLVILFGGCFVLLLLRMV